MYSEDIPVTYKKNNEMVNGFADPRSFILKNSSKLFPPTTVLPPMYKVKKIWK